VRAVATLIEAVRDRSGHRCEVVDAGRCPNRAVEVHHRLPRARARIGDEHWLDLAADVDNLADVCGVHHRLAHGRPSVAERLELVGLFGDDHPAARRVGLYVRGDVTGGADGRLVYRGPSVEYLLRVPTLSVR
jgi:hypothetical protein